MNELSEMGEVRDLVRRAILDVLREEQRDGEGEAVAYEQRVPAQHELTIVLRGSERAIGLLENALGEGEQMLEIAIGERFGPKARAHGRLA
ncbi:hypothetical protein [Leucobacter ruminantium]|uniref:Uncharacterized protein n=1 Tax=Leucobacter ruminantium TaxID=1289170 RepID=A0A939RXU2_9MICO|nr:hypothetical protein [Leucobacter ruminantium]MBO1803784.1 hypothetical protein [Leucobacter ruminantium]